MGQNSLQTVVQISMQFYIGAIGEDSNAVGIGGSQDNNLAEESGAVYFY